ncbi:MAG: ferritin-like domain-containing protein [Sphingobacteriaceae bacterium]|nr:MAG: ferritin-like domain-containing protein [Sphingobacteriaceae bacterium]
MNLLNIIQEIEKVDPEFQEKISPRRAAIKNITSFGSKVAVAAIPFALGSLFKKAYAQQSATNIVAILNYALTLEYLEANFYNTGLGTTTATTFALGTPSATEIAGLKLIQTDENNHVTFLRTAISSLGGTPVTYTAAQFDFTGSGNFPTVFTNFNTFIAVAESFEDTGVRAYKGRAPELLNNQQGILTAALNIHSVEARHASHLRMLRRLRGVAIKPWVTSTTAQSNDSGIPQVDAVYGAGTSASFPAENNTTQGGVNILSLAAVSGTTSVTAATESFDEPLDSAAVINIVKLFAPFLR